MAVIANLSILMTADVVKAENSIRNVSNSIGGMRNVASQSSGAMAYYSVSLDSVRHRANLAKEGIGFFGNAVSLVNPALGSAINNVERLSKDIGQLTDVAKAGGVGMAIFKAGVVAAVGAMALKITVSIADWVLGVEKFNKAIQDGLDKASSQAEKNGVKINQAYEDRIELINLTKTGQERINALAQEEIALRKTLADNDKDIQAAQDRVRKANEPSVGKSVYRFFGGQADNKAAAAALENAQKIFKANYDALKALDKAKNPQKSELDKARDFQKLREEGLALAKTLQTPFEQFKESTERIIELAKAGAIDAATARKAIDNEAKQAQKSNARVEATNIQAITRGTAAALSPFLKRTESPDPVGRQVLAAQLAANKALESIDRKLKPNSVVYTPVSF